MGTLPMKRTDRAWVGQETQGDAKPCTACLRMLPFKYFSPCTRLSSGYSSRCTLCTNLFKFYKMSYATYEKMLNAQNGVCAICQLPPNLDNKYRLRLCGDHDHQTGAIRALLCHDCNHLLGDAREQEMFLLNAVAYLRKYRDS